MAFSANSPGRSSRRSHHRASHHASAHAEAEPVEQQTCDHPLATNQPPRLITQQDQLSELLDQLRAAGSFAFDSEFIGELTYVPKLCLIQAASTTQVALIDPLANLDIYPFWELVADPSVQKIVHAGQQDVEPVFRFIKKSPANLFDTQIAAGFIGMTYPLSLSRLTGAMLGTRLRKSLTFTNWERRPLSEQQLRYAADDVRYLPALRHEIGKRLEAGGKIAWALEESETLADPGVYSFDPVNQYLKIRGAAGLPPKNQAVLRELTIWRDAAARAEDVPPRTMLRDEIMMDLARSPVDSVRGLSQVRGLPRPVEMAHGEEIVAASKRAMSLSIEELPEPSIPEPTPPEKFRGESLFYAIQCFCAGRQIDPALVTSRQEIVDLLRLWRSGEDPSSLRICQGWRRQAVGEHLLAVLRGEASLTVRWTDDSLQTAANRL
jgi:ribonuclease D